MNEKWNVVFNPIRSQQVVSDKLECAPIVSLLQFGYIPERHLSAIILGEHIQSEILVSLQKNTCQRVSETFHSVFWIFLHGIAGSSFLQWSWCSNEDNWKDISFSQIKHSVQKSPSLASPTIAWKEAWLAGHPLAGLVTKWASLKLQHMFKKQDEDIKFMCSLEVA